MKEYYISSTKCNIQERKTKRYGTLYDVVFRITTHDGETKQKKLSGYKTKTLAKQAHAEFVTNHCELVKLNPIKKKNSNVPLLQPTFADLVPLYFQSLANQTKESTIYDRRTIFDSFLLPYFGSVKMQEISKEILYEWQDDLWSSKNPKTQDFFSYNYLSKIRSTLSAFLSWAEQRYDFTNHLSKIKKPKRRTQKTEMKFWTEQQFSLFIQNVEDDTYKTFFIFLFYTGRRKGEIFALTPQDVNIDKITFNKSVSRKTASDATYQVTSTKADKSQTLPISRQVQEAIRNYTPQQPFFFGGDKPLPLSTLTRTFEKACKKADLSLIRIHDLRHSFVSLLIHKGANMMVVADLIGDTVEQVMKTYGHLYQDDKINVISRL